MKNIFILKIVLCTLLVMVSCNKDFLEVKPLDKFSEVDIFKDPALTELYVNGIYISVNHPFNGFWGVMKAEFVDEAHDEWNSFFEFNNSLISSDELQEWNFEIWDNIYKGIRYCNVFFEKIDQGEFDNSLVDGKLLKDRLKGEVHFLRAYFYHQLVSIWGGVPIIESTFALTDEFNVARNTYKECIDFIVEECDLAASLLPEVNTGKNLGRASKGAALALKSEVLLYAASDMHNHNTLFSGFEKPELLGYVDGSSHDRWVAAKNAAKAVMDLGLYGLHKPDPSPTDSIALNYAEIFTADETDEDIYVRYFMAKDGGIPKENEEPSNPNNLPLVSGPNGYHLWGQNTPIGNLVDDYEMADGTPFSWSNPAQASAPYKNRDQRLYGTVLYEGVKWRERPTDGAATDPIGVIQVGTWEKWDPETNTVVNIYGLDTRNGSIEPFNGGYTGYYLRKFIDPSVNGQYTGQSCPWRYFRYSEILLNYAEACIELSEDGEALNYLNQIRKRAGMPDLTGSGAVLKAKYRHERRIELAYEDNRFYDVRRWMMGPEAYSQATGVDVIYKIKPDHTTSAIPEITPKIIQERSWDNKAYFFPIMRDELNKNNKLIQNPGY